MLLFARGDAGGGRAKKNLFLLFECAFLFSLQLMGIYECLQRLKEQLREARKDEEDFFKALYTSPRKFSIFVISGSPLAAE